MQESLRRIQLDVTVASDFVAMAGVQALSVLTNLEVGCVGMRSNLGWQEFDLLTLHKNRLYQALFTYTKWFGCIYWQPYFPSG